MTLVDGDQVRVFDRHTLREIRVIGGDRRAGTSARIPIDACGLSRDDSRLATVSSDGLVETWDVETGDRLAAGAVVGSVGYSVGFSPDTSRLVVAARDGMYLLDADTLEVIVRIQSHDSYVTSASFSPDGTRIASVSGDGTARIYDSVPIQVRRRQRLEYTALEERMTPIVEAMLEDLGDGGAVWDTMMADDALIEGERAAARIVLMTKAARTLERAARDAQHRP